MAKGHSDKLASGLGGVGVGWSEEGRVRRYIGTKDSLKRTVYSRSLFFYLEEGGSTHPCL